MTPGCGIQSLSVHRAYPAADADNACLIVVLASLQRSHLMLMMRGCGFYYVFQSFVWLHVQMSESCPSSS